MAGIRLKVKSWDQFQHYKNRNPPWIKLHRNILDNYEFACLPLASKALAPLLWILAAESNDGSIELDSEKLAFRLRVASTVIAEGIPPLVDSGFFLLESDSPGDASILLAQCLRLAPKKCSETERETETEGEGEGEALTKGGVVGTPWCTGGAEKVDPITGEIIHLDRARGAA
jgi:hypothetical protein